MRLLVTRPEPEAGRLAAELRALGHEPVLQPLLEFRRLDFDPARLKAAGALIFTSGNALRALEEKPLNGAADVPAFCVGGETARRAMRAGFQVAATAGTAGELVPKIVSLAGKAANIVHVTGEHQAFDLSKVLSREGLSLNTLCVYRMKAREAFEPGLVRDMKAGRVDGAILMSPRTAEIFVALCSRHGLLDYAKTLYYFCIAGSVAKKLAPLEAIHILAAAKPNLEALLALLAASPPPGHDPVGDGR